jgi:hypothetical protein
VLESLRAGRRPNGGHREGPQAPWRSRNFTVTAAGLLRALSALAMTLG